MTTAAPTSSLAHAVLPPRPPLKWAGGKRWQVRHLLPLWTPHRHRRLVEPFVGGIAVALGLQPERAVLNDINPHLINFYRWLKRGLVIGERFDASEGAFYRNRKRFNALLAEGRGLTAEAAGLFYYLNRTGYNGLCRFNKSGGFNVPFGRYRTINYRYDFTDYRSVFSTWTFTNTHFTDVTLRRGDFVYADPPYDVEFTQYSKGGFSWSDQLATAEWLAKHPGPAVIVNQATPRVEALYRGLNFDIRLLEAPRRISSSGDRSPAREILATRNLAL